MVKGSALPVGEWLLIWSEEENLMTLDSKK
jgi:hypothetical protein